MRKLLLVLIAVILILSCVSCDSVVENKSNIEQPSMFVQVENTRAPNGGAVFVYYHKETKVMYWISYDDIATVMLDADGKPLLWEE